VNIQNCAFVIAVVNQICTIPFFTSASPPLPQERIHFLADPFVFTLRRPNHCHVLLVTFAVDTASYAIFAHRILSSVIVTLCGILSETVLRSGQSGVRIPLEAKRPDRIHYADVTAHFTRTIFMKK